MRLARIVKIMFIVVPLLLIAALVGGIAVLKSADFNKYKPQIAAEAKKATGRDLVIEGNLGVEVSLSPAIAVEGVSFANAEWGSRPDMVSLERFEAQVALLPLLFGRIEIDRLVLVGADILLEVNEQGRTNFDFAAAVPAETGGEAKKLEIPIGAREVVIEKSLVTYSNRATGASYKARIDQLALKGESMADPVRLVFEGSYNDAPVKASAVLGTPSAMLSPDNPWPVDLKVEAGGAQFDVTGVITEPAKAAGIDLAITIAGAELGELSALAGTKVPKLGAYSLSGKLAGDAEVLNFAGLKAALAGSDIGGDVMVRLAGARPAIAATLNAGTVDLTALGVGAAGDGSAKKDRVFPADPLPLDGLGAVDAKLQLEAKSVILAGARLEEASLGLSLSGGNLVLKPVQGRLAGGALDGTLQLDGRKKAASLATRVTLAKVDLGQLMKDMGVSGDLEGLANVKVDVAGSGASVAGIMAGLNGEASFVMGKGRVKVGALNTLIGGPTQVLGNILGGGDKDYTAINCAVVRFPVKKGVATAEPLVLDTDLAAFIGKGTVNFGKETLDLQIDPDVKKTTISAAVPVKIGGTLANPEYSLEKLAVARKVGGLLGIVLFPPAAIVGLGELGAGDDNPCIQQAKGGTQEKKGDGGAVDVLKGAGEGITKGIKGLFGN